MGDLATARDSLAAFAAMVGCPLEPWQARALELEPRVTTIVAPRQSGKSRSLAVLALWSAFRRREQRVLLVSAGEEASRRLLAEVRRIATGSRLLAGSVVDEQGGLLTLSNGSEVRSVPASERAVRGWTVDLLLVDEAAMVPDDLLLGAAFPTTAARPDARIVLASSATVASGAFYDHAIRGEQGAEHVRTFRWALADAHWISPSTIAAARESMSETRFAAEYEGRFASGEDALFSREALDRATADYLPVELAQLRGPARVLAGQDWGATTDRSAFVAIARVPLPGPRTFAVACSHRWRAGAVLSGVIDDIATSPAHFDTVAMETNGLGQPCAQELTKRLVERPQAVGGGSSGGYVALPIQDWLALDDARIERQHKRGPAETPPATFHTKKLLVHVSGESKAATYSSLRLLLDQGRLVLPAAAEDLRRELLMLRVDLSPSGIEKIEAGSGFDDLADALGLSLCPYKDRRTGRWTTKLAELADPRTPAPEPALPPRATLETVATPTGVRVPRLPIFQSVAGTEITVPPGVTLAPSAPRLDPRMERARERVRAAMATHEREEAPSG